VRPSPAIHMARLMVESATLTAPMPRGGHPEVRSTYHAAVTPTEFDRDSFLAHLASYLHDIPVGERRIVAIAGAPASGKSTIAADAERRLNELEPGSTALLPMDGFHYDDEALIPRGWRPRKGAPHTFDVGGFAAALRRLHANDEESVAVPRFDRTIEIARAGAILIDRSVRLIVSEGNYLLLDDPPWPSLRPFFDRTVLIVADMTTLEARNRQRWVDFGLDESAIRAKLEDNDMPNARLIYERSGEPDWIIHT
jgi:pantothenate kinase